MVAITIILIAIYLTAITVYNSIILEAIINNKYRNSCLVSVDTYKVDNTYVRKYTLYEKDNSIHFYETYTRKSKLAVYRKQKDLKET